MTWAAGYSRDGRDLLRQLGLERRVFGPPPVFEALAAAFRALCAELADDGSVRGTPAAWECETRAVLAERYGDAGTALRANALRTLMAADLRTATVLAYTGLAAHPRVAVALCEAMR